EVGRWITRWNFLCYPVTGSVGTQDREHKPGIEKTGASEVGVHQANPVCNPKT
ncbi:hypothetical protein RUMTOR_01385, partial [[Ruminococcus] torques ATCC 27756]